MIQRLRNSLSAHRALLRAWLILVGTLATFLLIQPFLIYVGFMEWANAITAQMLAFVLWLLGAEGQAQGPVVYSDLFPVEIVAECTAILPVVIFLAAVLATPQTTTRGRSWAFVVGVPAIVVFNLIRLVSLMYIGYLMPKAFETVHLLIWQPLMIIFSIALWLLWAERLRAARRSP